MTVESASFISQLVATNPGSSDPKSEGDDHLRLTKTVLQNQFPNLGAVAFTGTATVLNNICGGTFPGTGITTQTASGAASDIPVSVTIPTVGTAAMGVNNSGSTNSYGVATSYAYLATNGLPLAIGVNGTVDAIITTAGNLGLGGAPATGYKLDVVGTIRSTGGETSASGYGVRILNSTATGGGYITAAVGANAGLNISGDSGPITTMSNVVSSSNTFTLGTSGARWGNTYSVLGNFSGAVTIGGDTTGLGVGIARSKPASTSRASTTTLANDPDLVAPLGVGTYAVSLWVPVWCTTSSVGGLKAGLAFSGTSTSASFGITDVLNGAFGSATTLGVGTLLPGVSNVTVGTGVSGVDWIQITGTITVSVAGNLSFQWAQFSSSANAINMGQGGYLNCTKVA